MDNTHDTIVIRVAIKRPFYKQLDYQYALAHPPKIGCRVKVPLGNSAVAGIITALDVTSEFTQLKSVIELIDKTPLFDSSMFALLHWASHYYFHPLGEVLFHALPVSLRKMKKLPQIELWRVHEKAQTISMAVFKSSPKQRAMFETLKQGETSTTKLKALFGNNWRYCLNKLKEKDLLEVRKVEVEKALTATVIKVSDKKRLTLTVEQKQSVDEIGYIFKEKTPKPILLHGVTGSGKTEVYLRVIEPLLEAGQQILILVPEIGLTPQLLARFTAHYPQYKTVLLHSGLANGERLNTWIESRAGTINILIGTRSAIFTPFAKLGAIIVDEEHDASFKQQEGFLYHGRDMAVKRAANNAIPILLGSATPSLESLHNVNKQRYHYLRLSKRPGTSKLPQLVLQDIRSQPLEAGISQMMLTEIKQHIENKHQVMLFLNRRGFAPNLYCSNCGWHATCHHCDMGMTYHAKDNKLICHHCGLEDNANSDCPDCEKGRLTTRGQGTERIEQVLRTHFPKVPTIRIDRDSTSTKGSLENKLALVRSGKPVILVGTQMLSKGHDFPKITLVGILDIDQALFSMDFRAQERLSQQLLQVAGRAGRGEINGRVVLQTSQPSHPLLGNLLSKGYLATAQAVLEERELWGYPPFKAQALIRVSAFNEEVGLNLLKTLQQKLMDKVDNDFSLLGPMPSPLPKRADKYRHQLLLTASKRGQLHMILKQVVEYLISIRKTSGLRWVIDVDPQDFL